MALSVARGIGAGWTSFFWETANMNAREYLNSKQDGHIIKIGRWVQADEEPYCRGRGRAMIVDPDEKLAVFLEDCQGEFCAGTIVKFTFLSDFNADDQYRVSGSPANIRD